MAPPRKLNAMTSPERQALYRARKAAAATPGQTAPAAQAAPRSQSGGRDSVTRDSVTSDVHVTRHFSPVFRTFPQIIPHCENSSGQNVTLSTPKNTPKTPIRPGFFVPSLVTSGPFPEVDEPPQNPQSFCDWVSMYQDHPTPCKVIGDGHILRLDASGDVQTATQVKQRVEGSHESAIFIRSDGHTVKFEGNVSKFGRQDNVFGYTFPDCLRKINSVLASLDLPPFTAGNRHQVNSPEGWKTIWTGARITRLDLTENYQTGGAAQAAVFMRFLSSQQASRLKTGTHGEGETVDFGRGSRRVYSKAYLKGPEILRHLKKPKKSNFDHIPFDPYLHQVAQWCNEIGLVRFETTYKSTFLIDNHLSYLGGFDMSVLQIDFEKRKEVFTRATNEIDELTDLPKAVLGVYRMWQAGDDLAQKLGRSQFYMYRKKLLPFGVDIAVRSNVHRFEPKTRIITLGPVTPPDWYQLPAATLSQPLRLVA